MANQSNNMAKKCSSHEMVMEMQTNLNQYSYLAEKNDTTPFLAQMSF